MNDQEKRPQPREEAPNARILEPERDSPRPEIVDRCRLGIENGIRSQNSISDRHFAFTQMSP